MGAEQSASLKKRWAAQNKIVTKNRKKDGTEKYTMGSSAMDRVIKALQTEYPFLSSVSDSACLTDHKLPDEPIVYCNEEFTQLTGYKKEEILGRNCRFLQGKYSDPKEVAKIREALNDGTRLDIELLNYRKDGVPFINSFCMLPLHADGMDQKPTHFLAVQKDVTVLVNPFAKPMEEWSTPVVCMWLDKMEAASYIPPFLDGDVEGKELANMTVEGLQSYGVVLRSEQSRLMTLIAQQSRARSSHSRPMLSAQPSLQSVTSVDDTSYSESLTEGPGGRSTATESAKEEIESELSRIRKGTRKISVTVNFSGARSEIQLIIPSAKATLKELQRAMRKSFGRSYEVLEMKAVDGTKSKVLLAVGPPQMELPGEFFALLDGVSNPVVVTDAIGVVLFANDEAWSLCQLDDDPIETSIVRMGLRVPVPAKVVGKDLPYLKTLPSKMSVHTPDGKMTAMLKEVRMKKLRLYVWTLRGEGDSVGKLAEDSISGSEDSTSEEDDPIASKGN